MTNEAEWFHALRNQAGAASTALAVAQRALAAGDCDTASRFIDHGAGCMDRMRDLLASAPDVTEGERGTGATGCAGHGMGPPGLEPGTKGL